LIELHELSKNPVRLFFAVPDHPWSDEGAAVRIAMTGAEFDNPEIARMAELQLVTDEPTAFTPEDSAEKLQVRSHKVGKIFSNLCSGIDVNKSLSLKSGQDLCSRGMQLIGGGFRLSKEETKTIEPDVVHLYLNGRDLLQTSRGSYVIDLFGLSEQEVINKFPQAYQWVSDRVRPEREQNNRKSYRENWWIFGEPRANFRPALEDLSRYIATVETAKHRIFVFLDCDIVPDNMLVNIALEDAYFLGVLSSQVHVLWALAAGGTLEDRPRYNKTRCFDPFPFPDPTPEQKQKIRDLGERLDAHRKKVQADHPDITITGMYNLLEKLRAGEPFTDKDRDYNDRALVSTLKQIHDDLDVAVLEAYGWGDLVPLLSPLVGLRASTTVPPNPSQKEKGAEIPLARGERARGEDNLDDLILERLVALNAERAEEERNGHIRWLRPEYQAPDQSPLSSGRGAGGEGSGGEGQQQALPGITEPEETVIAPVEQQKFPTSFKDQLAAIRDLLRTQGGEWTVAQVKAQFKNASRKQRAIQDCLDSLTELGVDCLPHRRRHPPLVHRRPTNRRVVPNHLCIVGYPKPYQSISKYSMRSHEIAQSRTSKYSCR
jgi:hypothetical protein